MTAGAKTKLQVDGVISISSPSATNDPQATELAHRFLIVLSSMMLFKPSFGFTRSLFISYVHEHDRLRLLAVCFSLEISAGVMRRDI